jgi:hypothetical protein
VSASYHVINRGNGRTEVFREDGDYHAFIKAFGQAYLGGAFPGVPSNGTLLVFSLRSSVPP